jgi:hypothetical protein
VRARGLTLAEIVRELADMVAARGAAGRRYGVVLLPEGLIEHIQEVRGEDVQNSWGFQNP